MSYGLIRTPPTNRISEQYFWCEPMLRSMIIETNFVYAVGMELGSVWMQLWWIKWMESVMLNISWIYILQYAPLSLFSINNYSLHPPRRIHIFCTTFVSFHSVSVSASVSVSVAVSLCLFVCFFVSFFVCFLVSFFDYYFFCLFLCFFLYFFVSSFLPSFLLASVQDDGRPSYIHFTVSGSARSSFN